MAELNHVIGKVATRSHAIVLIVDNVIGSHYISCSFDKLQVILYYYIIQEKYIFFLFYGKTVYLRTDLNDYAD